MGAARPGRYVVRKIIIGAVGLIAGASTVLASGAFAGSNGAQRSGLSPQSGSNGSQCVKGSGAATNGFVMLNAPGKPGDANKLLGEVSLKNGPADTTYIVNVAVDDGNNVCMAESMLTTNGQGNGNAHIADTSGLKNGSYYVVLQNMAGGAEEFASGNLTVT
jgi:hypothetical protein